jgi:hypothetical protein
MLPADVDVIDGKELLAIVIEEDDSCWWQYALRPFL